MSQGGSRPANGAASKMLYSSEAGGSGQGGSQAGAKPRATSAYGNNSRRILPMPTNNNFIVQNMGAH